MVSIGFNFMDVDLDVEYMTCRGPLCCETKDYSL